jgi:hypothetical protein
MTTIGWHATPRDATGTIISLFDFHISTSP